MRRSMLLFTLALGVAGWMLAVRSAGADEVVVNATAAAATHSGHGTSAPCVSTVKVSVPKPDTKKITKVVYGCKEKDFCYPKCAGCCNQGCDAGCESCVRTKRTLRKKTVTVAECPTTKCEVEERAVEACPAPCVDRCGPGCRGCARPGCYARRADACEATIVVPVTPGKQMTPAPRTTFIPATAAPAAAEAQPLPHDNPR